MKLNKEEILEISKRIATGIYEYGFISFYGVDEYDISKNRHQIYNFDQMSKDWEGKEIIYGIYPEIPGAICSSSCLVFEKNTGKLLSHFSLNDEG